MPTALDKNGGTVTRETRQEEECGILTANANIAPVWRALRGSVQLGSHLGWPLRHDFYQAEIYLESS